MAKKEKEYICSTCRYKGKPVQITKGSFIIEVALWLLFILPGLLYSLWRLSSRYEACPQCHNPKLPHHVCPTCGTYNGREVIKIEGQRRRTS